MTNSPAVVDFLDRLRLVTGSSTAGLHEPEFRGNESRYVTECIDSGYVSSVGEFVTRFEQSITQYVGSASTVAIVNGTSALHLALVAVGVRPGDEVLVPALSFVATANAVSHAGAIPHFVDVEEERWGIDASALREHIAAIGIVRDGNLYNRTTERPITAIIPMHTLGHPCAVADLAELADEFGLLMVEDAAESLGSTVGELHTGLFGRLGVFSFNGNKTITTGGGGAIVTKDEKLAGLVRHLSTTARISHPYEFDHDAVGYNYRMPNINAALGLAQMEQLPSLVDRQRKLFKRYNHVFSGGEFGEVHREPLGARSNYWLQALKLRSDRRANKSVLIESSVDAGIPVRPLWKPLNTLSPYISHPSSRTAVANDLYERVICLPSSASLTERDFPLEA